MPGDWENYVSIMGLCSFGEWGIYSLGWFSNRTGTSVDDRKARGKDYTRPPVPNLPLCYWSGQLFDLRAVVKWRHRCVAKSAYLSLWPPGYGVGDLVSSVAKGVCIWAKTMVDVWAARLARSTPLPTALEYLVALPLCVYFCCCFLFFL